MLNQLPDFISSTIHIYIYIRIKDHEYMHGSGTVPGTKIEVGAQGAP